MKNIDMFKIYDKDDDKSIIHMLDYIYKNSIRGYVPSVREMIEKTDLSQSVIVSLKNKMIKCGVISECKKGSNNRNKILVRKDQAIKLMKMDNNDIATIWSNVIQEIKNKCYMNLYQQLKGSNAIVKDNKIIEIVVYDPKPITLEFLYKQSNIDIIESEISKALEKDTHISYKFINNNAKENYSKKQDDEDDKMKICKSKDYNKFKIEKGNRNVDWVKIEKIKNSMKDNFIINPIMVNEDFKIMDGQHRFYAAKELGLPIYYYISPGANIETARIMNENQKNWSTWDFVKSYADTGNEEYKKLIKLTELFPEINKKLFFIQIARNSFRHYKSHEKDPIKYGGFKFKDYEGTVNKIKKILDYKIVEGASYLHINFLIAVVRIMNSKNYDHKRMIDALKKYPYITNRIRTNEFIEELNIKFNYKKKEENRLYFDDIDDSLKIKKIS